MPRITPVHWKVLEKVFLAAGFRFARQEGSHRAYVKPDIARPLIIPTYTEVSVAIPFALHCLPPQVPLCGTLLKRSGPQALRSFGVALLPLRRYYYLICSRIFYRRNSVLTFPNFFNILHAGENSFMRQVHGPVLCPFSFCACFAPLILKRERSSSPSTTGRSLSEALLFMLNRLAPQILPRAGSSSSETNLKSRLMRNDPAA